MFFEEELISKYEVLDCHNVLITTYFPEEFKNILSIIKKYEQTYIYEFGSIGKNNDRKPKTELLLSCLNSKQNYKIYAVKYNDQCPKCFIVLDFSELHPHIVFIKKFS